MVRHAIKPRLPPGRNAGQALGHARALLSAYRRQVAKNVAGSLRGADARPLHDLRVALRRLRGVLRFFRPLLEPVRTRRLERELSRLCGRLGPARDTQVWLERLDRIGRRRAADGSPTWRAFRREQERLNQRNLAGLRRILRGAPFRELLGRIRLDPRGKRGGGQPGKRAFAARRLRKLLRRVRALDGRLAHLPPDELHAIRRVCRRARYGAEFSGPAVGPAARGLERRLKAITDALGMVHDLDQALARLRRAPLAVRSLAADSLAQERRAALRAAQRAWKMYRRLGVAAYRRIGGWG